MTNRRNEREAKVRVIFTGYITDQEGNKKDYSCLEFTLAHNKGEYTISCIPIKNFIKKDSYNVVNYDLYSGGSVLIRTGRFSKKAFASMIEKLSDLETLSKYAKAIFEHSCFYKDFNIELKSFV